MNFQESKDSKKKLDILFVASYAICTYAEFIRLHFVWLSSNFVCFWILKCNNPGINNKQYTSNGLGIGHICTFSDVRRVDGNFWKRFIRNDRICCLSFWWHAFIYAIDSITGDYFGFNTNWCPNITPFVYCLRHGNNKFQYSKYSISWSINIGSGGWKHCWVFFIFHAWIEIVNIANCI